MATKKSALLLASLGQESYTRKVARDDGASPPAGTRLRSRIRQCDGVLSGTPVAHHAD